jgi:branched-chain amino acid transport system substrate-binding protein
MNLHRATFTALAIIFSLAELMPARANLHTDVDKAARPPLKIGILTTLSGAVGAAGHETVDGMKLFLEMNGNTLGGRKVEFIVEDDQGDPATAVRRLKKLVEEDKVDILDGEVMANVGYALAPFVEKYKVPFVYPVAPCDNFTQRLHYNWIVRTNSSSSQLMLPFGDWAYKQRGYRKIAALASDFPFGYEAVGGFQKSFEDAGGKIVQKIWVPLTVTDYSPWITKVSKGADAILLLGVGQVGPKLTKQLREQGITAPIVACGTTFDDHILRRFDDEAIGAVSALPYSPTLNTEANRQFVKAYQGKYKRFPSHLSECGYTSVLWIDQALRSIGGDFGNKEKFLRALKQVKLQNAPRGSVRLDAWGNPTENIYLREVQKVNGHLQNTVIVTFPQVTQFWKYNPQKYLQQPPYSRDYPPCIVDTGAQK